MNQTSKKKWTLCLVIVIGGIPRPLRRFGDNWKGCDEFIIPFYLPSPQSKKDEVMRKRRNINVDEDEDTHPGGLGPVLTIEALQSLVMVGVA